MFTVRQASEADYSAVRFFYHSLIRAMKAARFYPDYQENRTL